MSCMGNQVESAYSMLWTAERSLPTTMLWTA